MHCLVLHEIQLLMAFQIKSFDEYREIYHKSIQNPDEFWSEIAGYFTWEKKWDNVSSINFKEARFSWFTGAQLNITSNCLDRHLVESSEKTALLWEPNNPQEPHLQLSYKELFERVCHAAEVLRNIGVKKGDRVCIYMGMIPELLIAMLACARVGAIHSIIFGGFSAQSIKDRCRDANASFIITCDGSFRGSKTINLKATVDEAIQDNPDIKSVLVVQRTGTEVFMKNNRDVWWHEEHNKIDPDTACTIKPETMDAEDPLFILYTSGSTGKPKGVVHSSGGYMVYTAYSFSNVFQYQPGQVYFCTADIGWITGHSYIAYGPLLMGATTLMFEGIPTWPDAGRFWDIVDKYQVNILYTAPTAIRSLMSFGLSAFENKDLNSLKVLGTVGETINEEAWNWYFEHVGKQKCPIVDTWWQTETGGIIISNLAGVTPQKASFATLPLPGIQLAILDEHGAEITSEHKNGFLCIKSGWPSMIRTTYGDHERCRNTYFSQYPGYYFTGDGAYKDENGFVRITGRVDDVLNISGHRIGTAEVENTINHHPEIIESAIVGYPHEIKGQAIYAFVVYNGDPAHQAALRNEINNLLTKFIGPIAKADKIQFVEGLPKTRSGKIMRRILRKIAEGEQENFGDTTTLLDPEIVQSILANRL